MNVGKSTGSHTQDSLMNWGSVSPALPTHEAPERRAEDILGTIEVLEGTEASPFVDIITLCSLVTSNQAMADWILLVALHPFLIVFASSPPSMPYWLELSPCSHLS